MEGPLAIALVPAPWGPIRLAATDRGLVAVDQVTSAEAFGERLARRFRNSSTENVDWAGLARGEGVADVAAGGRPAAVHLGEAATAFERYLAGDLSTLAELAVDLEDRPEWDQLVLGAVRGIPPGDTASYGEVARMIGRAGAARAVGSAVGRNPLGPVIPCHRVIAGDGTLGGYGGGWWGGRQRGLELKRQLLEREGVHVQRSAGGT